MYAVRQLCLACSTVVLIGLDCVEPVDMTSMPTQTDSAKTTRHSPHYVVLLSLVYVHYSPPTSWDCGRGPPLHLFHIRRRMLHLTSNNPPIIVIHRQLYDSCVWITVK